MAHKTDFVNIVTAAALGVTYASIVEWLPWVLGVAAAITAIIVNIIAMSSKLEERNAARLEARKHEMEIKKLEE